MPNTHYPIETLVDKDAIYIATDERSLNYKWIDESAKDLNAGALVLSEVYLPQLQAEGIIPYGTRVGDILVRNPFNVETAAFCKIGDAARNIREAKWNNIVQLATTYLGASNVHLEIKEIKTCNKEIDANGNIKTPVWEVKLDVKHQNDITEQCSSLYDAMGPGAARLTIEQYEAARAKAKEFYLLQDPEVQTLLRLRDPRGFNSNHYHARFSLTSEENSVLDVALSFSTLKKTLNIGAGMVATMQKRTEITIEVTFDFPPIQN